MSYILTARSLIFILLKTDKVSILRSADHIQSLYVYSLFSFLQTFKKCKNHS